jgi:hypothetical protein
MKDFKIEKIPLESLLDLLIKLYESGVDYVDLSADNSDPHQDKLVIITKEGYINPEYYDEEALDEYEKFDEEPKRLGPIIETRKLSDDDIEKLL